MECLLEWCDQGRLPYASPTGHLLCVLHTLGGTRGWNLPLNWASVEELPKLINTQRHTVLTTATCPIEDGRSENPWHSVVQVWVPQNWMQVSTDWKINHSRPECESKQCGLGTTKTHLDLRQAPAWSLVFCLLPSSLERYDCLLGGRTQKQWTLVLVRSLIWCWRPW